MSRRPASCSRGRDARRQELPEAPVRVRRQRRAGPRSISTRYGNVASHSASSVRRPAAPGLRPRTALQLAPQGGRRVAEPAQERHHVLAERGAHAGQAQVTRARARVARAAVRAVLDERRVRRGPGPQHVAPLVEDRAHPPQAAHDDVGKRRRETAQPAPPHEVEENRFGPVVRGVGGEQRGAPVPPGEQPQEAVAFVPRGRFARARDTGAGADEGKPERRGGATHEAPLLARRRRPAHAVVDVRQQRRALFQAGREAHGVRPLRRRRGGDVLRAPAASKLSLACRNR